MKLFVYGTLLSSFQTASLLPSDDIRHPAMTIGRMYHYIPGCYPVIALPNNMIRVSGSLDYSSDEILEQKQKSVDFESFKKIYRHLYKQKYTWIYGELIEITRPAEVMPVLDRYEGFNPDNPLYHRSLTPVKAGEQMLWAWVYHFKEDYPFDKSKDCFLQVPDGNWLSFIHSMAGGSLVSSE